MNLSLKNTAKKIDPEKPDIQLFLTIRASANAIMPDWLGEGTGRNCGSTRQSDFLDPVAGK